MDGCSRLGALMRVILPLAAPGLLTTAMFGFLLAWDEFLYSLIFTSTTNAKTIPVAIAEFTGKYSSDFGLIAAGGVLATAATRDPRAALPALHRRGPDLRRSERLNPCVSPTASPHSPTCWPAAPRPCGRRSAMSPGRMRAEVIALVGIGASEHAARSAAPVWRDQDLRAFAVSASELQHGGPAAADVYVGLSESGRSAETIASMSALSDVARVGVSNVADSPLADVVDHLLCLDSGPDSPVYTTGYTATLQALGHAGGELVRSQHRLGGAAGAGRRGAGGS